MYQIYTKTTARNKTESMFISNEKSKHDASYKQEMSTKKKKKSEI